MEKSVRLRELLIPMAEWRRDMSWVIMGFTFLNEVDSCVAETRVLIWLIVWQWRMFDQYSVITSVLVTGILPNEFMFVLWRGFVWFLSLL